MVTHTDFNARSKNSDQDEEEEEDDYMSMTFSEPAKLGPETSIQRRARKQREGELKAKVLSKAEQAAKDAENREQALGTSIDPSNKGYQLMAKLGFKGGSLGKEGTKGRIEPIRLTMKEDRGGIGLDTEKKRKIREEAELIEKQAKVDEGDYLHRIREEREDARLEGLVIGAMKVAERLDAATEDVNAGRQPKELPQDSDTDDRRPKNMKHHPASLSNIPVVWRGLVRHREKLERERRMRHDLTQSLSRLPRYADAEEDDDDRKALTQEEEQVEEDDPELDEFDALDPFHRLTRIVDYLRINHWYCFWCKHKYSDASLSGCPGSLEEDHD